MHSCFSFLCTWKKKWALPKTVMQTVLFFGFYWNSQRGLFQQPGCCVVDRKIRKKCRWKIYSSLIYSLYSACISERVSQRAKAKAVRREHETGALKQGWLESQQRDSIQLFRFLFCGKQVWQCSEQDSGKKQWFLKKTQDSFLWNGIKYILYIYVYIYVCVSANVCLKLTLKLCWEMSILTT